MQRFGDVFRNVETVVIRRLDENLTVGWNERQGFQRFFIFFYRLWRCAAGVRTFLSALKRGMFHLSKPTLPGAA